MYDLIVKLKSTNSSIEKLELLKTATEYDKSLFKLAYDPFTQFGIKKFKFDKIGILELFETREILYILLSDLKSRKFTGNVAIELVTNFGNQLTKESQEVFSLLLKKDFKCGVNVKLLQKAFGDDFIKSFSVQLANKYDASKNYKTGYWYASPKLDGIRCIFIDNDLYTRSGHKIFGLDKILVQCKAIVSKFNLDFIDGELYSDQLQFQEIQGIVTSSKNMDASNKDKIYFNVFAVGNKLLKDTSSMCKVINLIQQSKLNLSNLFFVKYEIIENNPDVINEYCDRYMQRGYEGVMLRDVNNYYDWKRSNALLKHKQFIEHDFEIVGTFPGNMGTKYQNTLGGLMISGTYEGKEILSEVGSGFSDELRDELFQMDLLGKLVEVKFQNVTDTINEKTGTYSLRFPVFLKLKLDR